MTNLLLIYREQVPGSRLLWEKTPQSLAHSGKVSCHHRRENTKPIGNWKKKRHQLHWYLREKVPYLLVHEGEGPNSAGTRGKRHQHYWESKRKRQLHWYMRWYQFPPIIAREHANNTGSRWRRRQLHWYSRAKAPTLLGPEGEGTN